MRKYLIGLIASGLIGAVAMPGIASADVTGLSIGLSISPTKQDKKTRGPASVFFESNDAHDSGFLLPPGGTGCAAGAVTPACKFFPPSIQDAIAFPPDLKFDPGTLPDCSLTSIQGKDAASAKAACPRSVVGQGATTISTLSGTTISGTVTAFNGTPAGGTTLYLLVDLAGIATKPILQGTITGTTLTVAIPPVAGTAITHFDTTINKVVSKKARSKKTGKVTKTYFLSAKCSRGTWTGNATVTYQDGKVLTASQSQKCTQKKTKK